MSIACLGWGSLIWNPGDLPVDSNWRHDGPDLPLEFARQSGDGRITLVVTEGAVALTVFSARLDVGSLDDARIVLADREGIPFRSIHRSVGHWSLDSLSAHRESRIVGEWAQAAGHHGVVWTALKPKFGQVYGAPSSEQVVDYLKSLSGRTRHEAEIYVRRTPLQIRTVYRRIIEEELGWTPIKDV